MQDVKKWDLKAAVLSVFLYFWGFILWINLILKLSLKVMNPPQEPIPFSPSFMNKAVPVPLHILVSPIHCFAVSHSSLSGGLVCSSRQLSSVGEKKPLDSASSTKRQAEKSCRVVRKWSRALSWQTGIFLPRRAGNGCIVLSSGGQELESFKIQKPCLVNWKHEGFITLARLWTPGDPIFVIQGHVGPSEMINYVHGSHQKMKKMDIHHTSQIMSQREQQWWNKLQACSLLIYCLIYRNSANGVVHSHDYYLQKFEEQLSAKWLHLLIYR